MCNGDEIKIYWCCIVLNILIGNQEAYINKFFNIFVQIRYNFEKLYQDLCEDEQDNFGFDVKMKKTVLDLMLILSSGKIISEIFIFRDLVNIS